MLKTKLKTPVIFIVFNRPEHTKKALQCIVDANPSKILVVADGPRDTRPEDIENCQKTRSLIDNLQIEGCEIIKNYSDTNLGCKRRVSSGLDWAFSVVEEAIIIEDDCLADKSFFRFCEELLERYRENPKIASIAGNNFDYQGMSGDASYCFTKFGNIWGWATWRRAWKNYDVNIKRWDQYKNTSWLRDWLQDNNSVKTWTDIFNRVSRGEIDTWDYQWVFAIWSSSSYSILPRKNLISNIGFDQNATHTKTPGDWSELPTASLEFPLIHPEFVAPDEQFDNYIKSLYVAPKLTQRIARWVGKIFP